MVVVSTGCTIAVDHAFNLKDDKSIQSSKAVIQIIYMHDKSLHSNTYMYMYLDVCPAFLYACKCV